MKDVESNNIEFSFALEENPQEEKRGDKKEKGSKNKAVVYSRHGYFVFVFLISLFLLIAPPFHWFYLGD